MKVSAIVLAAGQSKRMGVNKLLLDMRGKTLIERVVKAVLHSNVDRVIVVAGFEWERVQRLFHGKDVLVVFNSRYREGMGASIREGLRHIEPGTDAVLIALGDHPFLTRAIVDRLVRAYDQTPKGIVCPTYEGKRGHPVIFDLQRYAGRLSGLGGDVGGRALIERNPADLLEVPVDSPAVIRDIDSWDDYRECLQVLGGKPRGKKGETVG